MAVRRGRPATSKTKRTGGKVGAQTRTQRGRKTTTPVKKPAQSKRGAPKMDVTEYATKAPTEYHKAFARWIVQEVGYVPTNRKDLLMGVSIATAARPKFMESEFLQEWREKSGEAKRGPKPKNEPVEDDDFEDESDEFEDEESEEDDDFDDDDDNDDNDDDDDEEDDDDDDDDDDDEDDEESDDDDEDWEDDEEEEEPVKPARKAPAKKPATRGRTASTSRSRASKSAPAKSTRSKAKSNSDDDDDFLF